MGRALFVLTFAGVLAVFGYLLAQRGMEGSPLSDVSEENRAVEIAERHDRAVATLERTLDRALKNARQAEELSRDLDEAIREAEASAQAIASLPAGNNAASTAREATGMTAQEAADVAVLQARYAQTLSDRLVATSELADEAVKMAEAVEKVERTRAEVRSAAQEAAEAQAQLEQTEGSLRRNSAGGAP